MHRFMNKNLIVIIFVSVVALIEIGLMPILPVPLSYISPVSLILIFLISKKMINAALVSAIFAGLLFDIFSTFPPGVFTLSLVAFTGFTGFLFFRLVTDRSTLSTAALTLAGMIFSYVLLLITRELTFLLSKDQTLAVNLTYIAKKIIWLSLTNSIAAIICILIGNNIKISTKRYAKFA